MKVKGVIFDLDGLILDTEKLYQKFWKEASMKCGYKMSEETVLKLRSLDSGLAREMLKETFGKDYSYEKVKQVRAALMAEYVEQHGIEAKPGVRELSDHLKANGLKTAIATATNYERATCHLKLAGVRDCFEDIICACELEHGKPFPDVYLYACKKLGLKPEECIALEDSPNGVRSAHAAGCRVICVPDHRDVEDEVKPLIAASAESLADVIGIIERMK